MRRDSDQTGRHGCGRVHGGRTPLGRVRRPALRLIPAEGGAYRARVCQYDGGNQQYRPNIRTPRSFLSRTDRGRPSYASSRSVTYLA